MIIQSKVWGKTQKIFGNENFEIHRIEVEKGGYCSKHYHKHKYNMFFIESGELTIKIWRKDSGIVDSTPISEGQSTVVDPGSWHMFIGGDDTVAYEIYWTESISEDIVREFPGGVGIENECMYGDRFFRRRVGKFEQRQLDATKIIYDVFKPKSVFDFGCGIGSYLLAFKRIGCKVTGCDKYYNVAKKYINDEVVKDIFPFDIGFNRIKSSVKYDLVQCIEVAEHLAPWKSESLVDTLTYLSGRHILFSAAQPGQKGRGHVNCRTKSYWIDLFEKRGFFIDEKLQSEIINRIIQDGDTLSLAKNIMVFRG